jgi:N utilization substance protein A
MDERNRIMEIMVEDDKLAQAIGKRGQNVRLAALLTNWKLDIISRSKLQRRASDATYSLQIIEGVNDTMAQAIYQAGFLSPQQVAEADLEDVQKIPGYIEAEQATKLKERAAIAADHIAKNQSILANAPEALAAAAAANNKDNNTQPKDSKSLAEERLREMMKQAQQ